MKTRFLLTVLLLGIIGPVRMVMAQSTGTSTPSGAPNTARAAQLHMTAGYAKLPMSFEPCFEAMCAEAGSQAKYFSRGSGYLLFLTSTEAVLDAGPSKESTLRMKLLRSNSRASMEGMDPLPGKSNYFIGKNPKNWRSNVTNYAKVRYRNVYRGVDLVYYGNGSQLEYDFVVARGRRPARDRPYFSGRAQRQRRPGRGPCAGYRQGQDCSAQAAGVAANRRDEEGNRRKVRGHKQERSRV